MFKQFLAWIAKPSKKEALRQAQEHANFVVSAELTGRYIKAMLVHDGDECMRVLEEMGKHDRKTGASDNWGQRICSREMYSGALPYTTRYKREMEFAKRTFGRTDKQCGISS